MQKKIKVWSDAHKGCLVLTIVFKKAESLSTLKMNPELFYKKWREDKNVPQFPHYEMEILALNLLGSVKLLNAYKVLKSKNIPHIHIETVKDRLGHDQLCEYVCWTGDLGSIKDAETTLKAWAIGTFWTILNQKDFAQEFNVMNSCDDMKKFIHDESHGIQIEVIDWIPILCKKSFGYAEGFFYDI